MTTNPLKSPTQILEELIRFRAENVSNISMVIYPEALVELLNEKDNKIKSLEEELSLYKNNGETDSSLVNYA